MFSPTLSFPKVLMDAQLDRTRNEGLLDLLPSPCLSFSAQICPFDPNLRPSLRRSVSLQDVQVDRRVLDQGYEAVVDFLDDETLLRFSLPAPLHELVDLFRTRPRPLQLPALRDALDRLHTTQTFSLHSGSPRHLMFDSVFIYFLIAA